MTAPSTPPEVPAMRLPRVRFTVRWLVEVLWALLLAWYLLAYGPWSSDWLDAEATLGVELAFAVAIGSAMALEARGRGGLSAPPSRGRPRQLTVRAALLVVALVAMTLGAGLMQGRRDTYRERSDRAAEEERDYRWSERQLWAAARSRLGPAAARLEAAAELQRRRGDWSAAMREKYRGAAEAPWRFVAPDPPWPK